MLPMFAKEPHLSGEFLQGFPILSNIPFLTVAFQHLSASEKVVGPEWCQTTGPNMVPGSSWFPCKPTPKGWQISEPHTYPGKQQGPTKTKGVRQAKTQIDLGPSPSPPSGAEAARPQADKMACQKPPNKCQGTTKAAQKQSKTGDKRCWGEGAVLW